MRESRTYGSVRGAGSNARPYRDIAHYTVNVRIFSLDPKCPILAAIKAALPARSVAHPPERNGRGEYLLGCRRRRRTGLRLCARRGESYSDAVIRMAKAHD
jgi:hypothetical protein